MANCCEYGIVLFGLYKNWRICSLAYRLLADQQGLCSIDLQQYVSPAMKLGLSCPEAHTLSVDAVGVCWKELNGSTRGAFFIIGIFFYASPCGQLPR